MRYGFFNPRPPLVIPAEAGIQKRTLWRNALLDWLPFGQKRTYWIPAFAGMTRVGKLAPRHMRLPWSFKPELVLR
jgi:hypothetical protein